MPEQLHTCPHCGRTGFLASGLRRHVCKASAPTLHTLSHTMPKARKTKPAALTVLTASEVPDHVAHVFAGAGEKVTAELVAGLYETTETKKADWLAHAIFTGTLLIARQEFVPHGSWTPFLQEVSKLATRGQYGHADSTRSLRRYMTLAGRLLRPLLDPISVHGSHATHPLALVAQKNGFVASSSNIRALVLDPSTALPLLNQFIAGRTLRELTADLQAAEEAAAALEPKPNAGTTTTTTRGTGNEILTPARPAVTQLLMQFDAEWAEAVVPGLDHIDQCLAGNDEALMSLPSADLVRYWEAVAEELTARATKASQAAADAKAEIKDDLLSQG